MRALRAAPVIIKMDDPNEHQELLHQLPNVSSYPQPNYENVLQSQEQVPGYNDYSTEAGKSAALYPRQTWQQNGSMIVNKSGPYRPGAQQNSNHLNRNLEFNTKCTELFKEGIVYQNKELKKSLKAQEQVQSDLQSKLNTTVSKYNEVVDQHKILTEEHTKLKDELDTLRIRNNLTVDELESMKIKVRKLTAAVTEGTHIIADLENQLTSLKTTHETEMKELKEMADLEKGKFTTANHKLMHDIDVLNKELAFSNEEHKAVKKRLETAKSQVEQLDVEVQKVCCERNLLKHEKTALETNVTDLSNENIKLKTKVEDVKQELESEKVENEHLTVQFEQQKNEKDDLKAEIESLEKKYYDRKVELDEVNSKNALFEFKNDTYKNNNEFLVAEKQKLTRKLDALESDANNLETNIQNLEAENRKLASEKEEADSKHSTEILKLKQELRQLGFIRDKSEGEIEDLRERIASIQEKLMQKENAVLSLQREIARLKTLLDSRGSKLKNNSRKTEHELKVELERLQLLQIEYATLNKTLNQRNAEVQALNSNVYETVKRNIDFVAQRDKSAKEVEKLKKEKKELKKEHDKTSNLLNNKEEELKAKSQEVDSLKVSLGLKENIILELQEDKEVQLKLMEEQIEIEKRRKELFSNQLLLQVNANDEFKRDVERMKMDKESYKQYLIMKIRKLEREIKRLNNTLQKKEKDNKRLGEKVKDFQDKINIAKDELVEKLKADKEKLSKQLNEWEGENKEFRSLFAERIHANDNDQTETIDSLKAQLKDANERVKTQKRKSESRIIGLQKELQQQKAKVDYMTRAKSIIRIAENKRKQNCERAAKNKLTALSGENARKPVATSMKRCFDDDDNCEIAEPQLKKFHSDDVSATVQAETNKICIKMNQIPQKVSITERIDEENEPEPGEIVDDDE